MGKEGSLKFIEIMNYDEDGTGMYVKANISTQPPMTLPLEFICTLWNFFNLGNIVHKHGMPSLMKDKQEQGNHATQTMAREP